MSDVRHKLTGLLDYVEQVVRLDERVAFRLSEYGLPDRSTFSLTKADTHNLPSVRHDHRDEDGSVWLEVERLSRKEPPAPPQELAEWIVLSSEPSRPPEIRNERLVTVTAGERDIALANGEVRPDDVLEAPRKRSEPENAPPRFDLRLRLEDRPNLATGIAAWIAGTWTPWSVAELPRRKTIAVYQVLYKIFQLLQVGAAESPIELMWGIGVVHWQKDGKIIDRPLLERRVDLELDDNRGGLIRVRPTASEALFDLKPYEELGCTNLANLSDLIRREIQRTSEEEGISPFIRESFEPILSAAGARLDPGGVYAPDSSSPLVANEASPGRLTVTDKWVLFARPRSQHVVLQDIDRLRRSANNEKQKIEGLAERLVTHPSNEVGTDGWQPLSPRIGGTTEIGVASDKSDLTDIFFPKPFNDDQLEIIRRLSRSDGLVVQGPPGTGKTHTIANLICHAMATGQRVLVVSRGEAALTVLKEQLPKQVQPLAISVLSNEREGLRQIESAIREVQSIVEETQPQNRRTTIARLEQELVGLEQHIRAIDLELDEIASAHLTKLGPRGETPAELAQRIVRERDAYAWFTDRPTKFSAETALSDRGISALYEARRHCKDFLDHIEASLPSPSDLPTVEDITLVHDHLVAAAAHEQDVAAGPARALQITEENAERAQVLAHVLDELARLWDACHVAHWAEPFRVAALRGGADAWCERLRERVTEWVSVGAERAALLKRATEIPAGCLNNADACEAVARAAAGRRLWPLMTIGKGPAKALVNSIRLDGASIRDDDQAGWRHVAAALDNLSRQREASARWESLAQEISAPGGDKAKAAIDLAAYLLRVCDEVKRERGALATITANAYTVERLADDPALCRALVKQLRAAANAAHFASAERERRRLHEIFAGSDRTSILVQQFITEALGNRALTSERVAATWHAILRRLDHLKGLVRVFEVIKSTTAAIAVAGAPKWAERLRHEPAVPDEVIAPVAWREAWDHAAADATLERIDERHRVSELATDRERAETQCRKLYGEIVRERTFYELDRRLSPAIKAALVEFVRALVRIGRGTGKTAWVHRKTARDAMARCYSAVPCWIMPTWRVAEQLPADLGVLDLVIIDEASQSDITELPALLRGKKVLVVGDDRQVSPTAPFVTQEKIDQLRHHYLGDVPFKSLLSPGESIYDLMRAVFPDQRLMLKEHFRCVEPIIQFSMQFYPEKMLPLRIPSAHERLDPPLIDIYVPHGKRGHNKKINLAEAEVIVDEIAALARRPEMRERTVGVISLIGKEQADHIRQRLSETVGEEIMQRHAILCGDSATFQGSERDIVYLSMVADSINKTALTMQRYEQRFNVAVSRARDRAVLVRSIKREELNPHDLKARLIAHFESPMPDREQIEGALSTCESNFERDLMQRLLDRGYRVQAQVGSLGYRIDMVVENSNGTRLAVECDGDRFHGPEQWQNDMRRQRTLERVGWRFWRCFASSFYRDPDAVMIDLTETLTRMGIEPVPANSKDQRSNRFTEHRVVHPAAVDQDNLLILEPHLSGRHAAPEARSGTIRRGISLGDKVVLLFSDDHKRMSVRLTEGTNYLEKGRLSVTSPLGRAILGAEEGDEVELTLENGKSRTVLIESIEAASPFVPTMLAAE
jgi:very-short-patch-repair endonuclease